MAKKQWISLLGLWTTIFLFLGFPATWDKWLAVITGILIILITYSMRNSQTSIKVTEEFYRQETFVENSNVPKI
jgi:hypothetical protein